MCSYMRACVEIFILKLYIMEDSLLSTRFRHSLQISLIAFHKSLTEVEWQYVWMKQVATYSYRLDANCWMFGISQLCTRDTFFSWRIEFN